MKRHSYVAPYVKGVGLQVRTNILAISFDGSTEDMSTISGSTEDMLESGDNSFSERPGIW